MTNPYNHPGYEHPTEAEAKERELAFIEWQKQEVLNEVRALNAAATTTCPYHGVDVLRRKLTSWPIRLSKWFDVTKALALGWWNQLTPKEQRSIADFTVVIVGCSALVLVFVWMAAR